jgi:hypothetical protein
MSDVAKRISPPVPVVALAGWVLPGSGYWLLGDKARALTVGITILLLFGMGCLIGGVRVVEAPTGAGTIIANVSNKPWFVGQVLAGPVSLIAAYESSVLANDPNSKNIVGHSRIAEIPTLYTAVAGMLNLLAIIDAAAKAAGEATR